MRLNSLGKWLAGLALIGLAFILATNPDGWGLLLIDLFCSFSVHALLASVGLGVLLFALSLTGGSVSLAASRLVRLVVISAVVLLTLPQLGKLLRRPLDGYDAFLAASLIVLLEIWYSRHRSLFGWLEAVPAALPFAEPARYDTSPYYSRLLGMVQGDRALADRLIHLEFSLNPRAGLDNAVDAAIQKLIRDRGR